jgi:ribulose-bisphosphate carboxylase large chain
MSWFGLCSSWGSKAVAGRLDQREFRAMFSTRGGVDPEDHLIVHYRMTPKEGLTLEDAAARVSAITSIRTLGALPFETRQGRLEEAGKILSVQNTGAVSIAYPIELCTRSEGIAQLLTVIASGAEYDYTEDFWVDDLELPKTFIDRFQGPRFGVAGIRSRFDVPKRAMLGVVVKPRRGASFSDIADSAYECLLGGADFIVDDLLMVDPPGEMAFINRVPRLADVAAKATVKTGEQKRYIANVSTSAMRALELTQMAQGWGVGALTINAFVMGFSSAQEFIGRPEVHLPIITCNMGCGILTRPAQDASYINTGISEVVISKLCRLAGADGVHAGTCDSECYGQNVWGPSILALTAKLHHLQPVCAVAEGDITVVDVWANIQSLGSGLLLEPCSGVLAYPDGPRKGAAAFRALVEVLHADMVNEEATQATIELSKHDANVRNALEYYGFKP